MFIRNWIIVVLFIVQLFVLESLDLVPAALRTCLESFRTSNLHAEAGELLHELWRQQLCLQYMSELGSNPCNPAFSSVFDTGFRRLFEASLNTTSPTLGIRMNQHMPDSKFNLDIIAANSNPYIPPWLLKPPGFQLSMHLNCKQVVVSNKNSANFYLNMSL